MATLKERLAVTLAARGITRDSVMWTLGVVAAHAAYLSQCSAPSAWLWADWWKWVAFEAVWVCGQLGNSVLKGKP